jgi:hypothetical protein
MSTSEPPTDADWTREQMRRQDQSRFDQRVARALRTKSNNFMMPVHWFHVASSECREIFCDGHFNGCVCLVQAVAEGLTKFLVEHNPGARGNSQEARIRSLHSRHVISDTSRDALLLIVGADRNTFHHLNKDIPTDWEELERRAEECVGALHTVESEIFAYTIAQNGSVAPTHPKYWPTDGKFLPVYLRGGF